MSEEKDSLEKVISNYSFQLANLIEARVKQDGLDEGIEMDILLRALFLQISRKKKDEKFRRADLEKMVTKSFNEYASNQDLKIYAKNYLDPETPTVQ